MYSLNKPDLVTNSSILEIEDGRHLLVELFSKHQCIANDCSLNEEKRKMILTGANSSGKSVYLKQVGIITFLAHIGRYVQVTLVTRFVFTVFLVSFQQDQQK